uniref:Uncharacterized protein n=1 Tax=Steinernema glaseri TaxID=37863 RepID=A0A1I7ZE75_9BILA
MMNFRSTLSRATINRKCRSGNGVDISRFFIHEHEQSVDLLEECHADFAPKRGDLPALPEDVTIQEKTNAFHEEQRDFVHDSSSGRKQKNGKQEEFCGVMKKLEREPYSNHEWRAFFSGSFLFSGGLKDSTLSF